MATYNELKNRLENNQFLVFLTPDKNDPFKRIVVCENKAGLKRILGASAIGNAGLSIKDLPAIVDADVLIQAIRKSARVGIIWDTIDLSSQFGKEDGGIGQGQLDSIMESVGSLVDEKTKKVFRYKGRVNSVSDLPASDNEEGDVYRIASEGDTEYVWIVDENPHWEYLGQNPDLTNYYNKEEIDRKFEAVSTGETLEQIRSDISSLNDTANQLSGVNTLQNESIENLSAAHLSLSDRVSFTEKWFDFSSFEVYANNTVIPVGQSDVLGGYVSVAIPACMTHHLRIHTYCPLEKSDVVIDWGDGTHTEVAKQSPNSKSTESDGEIHAVFYHAYSEPGKYVIRIFGHEYYHFDCPSTTNNLLCRVFDGDLPMSSHLRHFGMICHYADRLINVQLNGYDAWIQDVDNFSNCFYGCKNLLSVKGFRSINSRQTDNSLFKNCINLETTDYQFPSTLTRSNGLSFALENCPSLAIDISKLFPNNGFTGTVNVNRLFYGDISLTGTVPASKLWENTNVVWTNTAEAFVGCSNDIRSQVPTSWGGTNSSIQSRIDSGYYNKVNKGLLDEAMSKMPKIEFIDGGENSSEPIEVMLNDCTWYIAVTSFTGMLPSNPVNGTVVQISYDHGQADMKVMASGNHTINNSHDACLIGVNDDGTITPYSDTHRFVYRNGNWILF